MFKNVLSKTSKNPENIFGIFCELTIKKLQIIYPEFFSMVVNPLMKKVNHKMLCFTETNMRTSSR